jgi:mannose-6-phosphate isomerase-like protein (cupin superfamily)
MRIEENTNIHEDERRILIPYMDGPYGSADLAYDGGVVHSGTIAPICYGTLQNISPNPMSNRHVATISAPTKVQQGLFIHCRPDREGRFGLDCMLGQVRLTICKQETELGGHYHNGIEQFIILKGQGVISLYNIDDHQLRKFPIWPGERITVPPRTVHRAAFTQGTQFLVLNEERYTDPAHNDLPYRDAPNADLLSLLERYK